MPSFPKPAHLLFLAAALAVLTAAGSCARAGEPALAADGASIQSCLALAQRNEKARAPQDELTRKTGPEDWLNAAREAAPAQAESCIGAAATACMQAEGNQSTAVMVECYGREADAWDARLNAAYKKALAGGEGADVAEGYRKTQRAWIAFRDAACAQPGIVFNGTMAGPMGAYCRMDMTARQAIWLEGWAR